MQTGIVECNLAVLAPEARVAYLEELIARKRGSAENERVTADEVVLVERDLRLLEARLVELGESTDLPNEPAARPALNDFVVRQRLSARGPTAH